MAKKMSAQPKAAAKKAAAPKPSKKAEAPAPSEDVNVSPAATRGERRAARKSEALSDHEVHQHFDALRAALNADTDAAAKTPRSLRWAHKAINAAQNAVERHIIKSTATQGDDNEEATE